MDKTKVIIKPLVTEKSTHQQGHSDAYAFQVAHGGEQSSRSRRRRADLPGQGRRRAHDDRKGKPRRTKFKMVSRPDWKRAVVVLDGELADRVVLGERVASCRLSVASEGRDDRRSTATGN
jgi:ribosomal protein L23